MSVRPTPIRVAVVAGVVFGTTAAWLAVRQLLAQRYLRAPLGDYAEPVLPALITGFMASQVSYRWRDGLWWLAPPVGVVMLIKFAWRLSNLPNRYWALRPDENHEAGTDLSRAAT